MKHTCHNALDNVKYLYAKRNKIVSTLEVYFPVSLTSITHPFNEYLNTVNQQKHAGKFSKFSVQEKINMFI